mmetsp:Transcript_34009/g.109170  ORF Transcript_34009/g.109170 Transcript_34009/m.109170 type:complete len:246 (-) Transcript_34009:823-1560(-)
MPRTTRVGSESAPCEVFLGGVEVAFEGLDSVVLVFQEVARGLQAALEVVALAAGSSQGVDCRVAVVFGGGKFVGEVGEFFFKISLLSGSVALPCVDVVAPGGPRGGEAGVGRVRPQRGFLQVLLRQVALRLGDMLAFTYFQPLLQGRQRPAPLVGEGDLEFFGGHGDALRAPGLRRGDGVLDFALRREVLLFKRLSDVLLRPALGLVALGRELCDFRAALVVDAARRRAQTRDAVFEFLLAVVRS